MINRADIERLQAAAEAERETGLVEWEVEEDSRGVLLVGLHPGGLPEDHELCKYPEYVFERYGGDAILADAGLEERFDKSGVDAYQDRFGDDVVSNWVFFRVQEDEQ